METFLIIIGLMLFGIIGTTIQIEIVRSKEEKMILKVLEEITEK